MASGTVVSGNLSIAPTGTATASVNNGANINASTLTLGGTNGAIGTWGSTSSSATNKNNTYFAPTTGTVTMLGLTTTFSGLTPGQAIQYGTTSVLLSGTVSAVGPFIRQMERRSTSRLTGRRNLPPSPVVRDDFRSISQPPRSRSPGTPYTITYAYTGNNMLKAVTDTSTTLTVDNKANQTITVTTAAPSTGVYGTTFPVAATGGSSGNPVTITTDGTVCTGSGSGSATITMNSGTGTGYIYFNQAGNSNYNPAMQVTESVSAQKATATVTLGSLSQTYDGTPKSATATTTPAGLTVSFTYNGSGTAPINAGSYAVTGTVNTTNYQGSASGTMVIGKAAATITLDADTLNQTYSGAPEYVTATTNPLGLSYSVTYNGSYTAPSAVGSYTVVATITDTNYTGSASGTLTITAGTVNVSSVSLYLPDHTTTVTAMTPQTEYAIRVTVNDYYTLANLSTVAVTIFYQSTVPIFPDDVPVSGNTQTAAILTCNVGTSPTWSINPTGSGTTWSIIPANCVQPTLSGTNGDFWFNFKPGKVATAASGKWYIYANATIQFPALSLIIRIT